MKYDNDGNIIPMSDKQVVSTTRKYVIGFGVLLLVIVVGGWLIGVVTSDAHGRGEQRKQINSNINRTGAQELFPQLYQDIKAYDGQITVQAAALVAHPQADAEHDRLAAVLSGLKNQCISTVQQYNAEAQKVTKARFRDAGLPEQIDTLDPSTDCKENA